MTTPTDCRSIWVVDFEFTITQVMDQKIRVLFGRSAGTEKWEDRERLVGGGVPGT